MVVMTAIDTRIEHYFDRAADPDLEAYFAQFADDAVVEDEGRLHHGIDAIRAWRTSVPDVTYRLVTKSSRTATGTAPSPRSRATSPAAPSPSPSASSSPGTASSG